MEKRKRNTWRETVNKIPVLVFNKPFNRLFSLFLTLLTFQGFALESANWCTRRNVEELKWKHTESWEFCYIKRYTHESTFKCHFQLLLRCACVWLCSSNNQHLRVCCQICFKGSTSNRETGAFSGTCVLCCVYLASGGGAGDYLLSAQRTKPENS